MRLVRYDAHFFYRVKSAPLQSLEVVEFLDELAREAVLGTHH